MCESEREEAPKARGFDAQSVEIETPKASREEDVGGGVFLPNEGRVWVRGSHVLSRKFLNFAFEMACSSWCKDMLAGYKRL